jgi:hypothetical protein
MLQYNKIMDDGGEAQSFTAEALSSADDKILRLVKRIVIKAYERELYSRITNGSRSDPIDL